MTGVAAKWQKSTALGYLQGFADDGGENMPCIRKKPNYERFVSIMPFNCARRPLWRENAARSGSWLLIDDI